MQLKKLNQECYALTFGLQNMPPMAHEMSKKWTSLNYKQHNQHLEDTGDMDMQKVTFEYQCPNVAEILVSPI